MSNPKTPTPSEFTHALTRISVAQILKTTGFKSAKSSALETLTRVAALFLNHLTTSAASRTSFSGDNPALHDLLSALQDLNFPLDFSPRHLSRFITDSDNLPFPRRVSKPDASAAAAVSEPDGGDSTRRRGPEVPLWLPAFPRISVDDDCNNYGGGDVSGNDDDDDENVKRKEVYCEERRGNCGVLPIPVAKEDAKEKGSRKRNRGRGGILVYRRRERVKFKLRAVREAKSGFVDDMELRNGVCRGGKRICLVKPANCNSIFDDDGGE